MKQFKLPYRIISAILLACYIVTNHFSTPAQASASHTVIPQKNYKNLNQLLPLPSELGKIQEIHKSPAPGRPFVILIQDAHAIPAAQKNIQKIIAYFQNEYGVSSVALEGAAEVLDPQIFKSFPDQEKLKKILQTYEEKGELAGGVAAALYNEAPAIYQGMEDWGLYEQGIGFYLKAMEQAPVNSEKLSALKKNLDSRKAATYSKALLEIDRDLEGFYENQSNLLDVLQKLSRIKSPKAGSELALILEEAAQDPAQNKLAEAEVRAAAAIMEKSIPPAVAETFNRKKQDFQTSRLTPQQFALWIKENIPGAPVFSPSLSRGIHNQKRMEDMQGTKFFEDFERYAAEVKEDLLRSEQEKAIDRESARLHLMERFNRLELTQEDWAQLPQQTEGYGDFSAHRDFYRTAARRDEVFMKNITKLLESSREKSTIAVAGGFHARGLMKSFEEKGISYALVQPEIEALPEQSFYRDQMRGEVSWKNYFKAENGKVNLYEAFVRATRDKLSADPLTLKAWRDQIIRDLAQKGRIESAGNYTPLIDEISKAPEKTANPRVEDFIRNLKQLEIDGQFNEQNVLNLLKPATTVSDVAGPAILTPHAFSPDGRFPYFQRAESRSTAEAIKAFIVSDNRQMLAREKQHPPEYRAHIGRASALIESGMEGMSGGELLIAGLGPGLGERAVLAKLATTFDKVTVLDMDPELARETINRIAGGLSDKFEIIPLDLSGIIQSSGRLVDTALTRPTAAEALAAINSGFDALEIERPAISPKRYRYAVSSLVTTQLFSPIVITITSLLAKQYGKDALKKIPQPLIREFYTKMGALSVKVHQNHLRDLGQALVEDGRVAYLDTFAEVDLTQQGQNILRGPLKPMVVDSLLDGIGTLEPAAPVQTWNWRRVVPTPATNGRGSEFIVKGVIFGLKKKAEEKVLTPAQAASVLAEMVAELKNRKAAEVVSKAIQSQLTAKNFTISQLEAEVRHLYDLNRAEARSLAGLITELQSLGANPAAAFLRTYLGTVTGGEASPVVMNRVENLARSLHYHDFAYTGSLIYRHYQLAYAQAMNAYFSDQATGYYTGQSQNQNATLQVILRGLLAESQVLRPVLQNEYGPQVANAFLDPVIAGINTLNSQIERGSQPTLQTWMGQVYPFMIFLHARGVVLRITETGEPFYSAAIRQNAAALITPARLQAPDQMRQAYEELNLDFLGSVLQQITRNSDHYPAQVRDSAGDLYIARDKFEDQRAGAWRPIAEDFIYLARWFRRAEGSLAEPTLLVQLNMTQEDAQRFIGQAREWFYSLSNLYREHDLDTLPQNLTALRIATDYLERLFFRGVHRRRVNPPVWPLNQPFAIGATRPNRLELLQTVRNIRRRDDQLYRWALWSELRDLHSLVHYADGQPNYTPGLNAYRRHLATLTTMTDRRRLWQSGRLHPAYLPREGRFFISATMNSIGHANDLFPSVENIEDFMREGVRRGILVHEASAENASRLVITQEARQRFQQAVLRIRDRGQRNRIQIPLVLREPVNAADPARRRQRYINPVTYETVEALINSPLFQEFRQRLVFGSQAAQGAPVEGGDGWLDIHLAALLPSNETGTAGSSRALKMIAQRPGEAARALPRLADVILNTSGQFSHVLRAQAAKLFLEIVTEVRKNRPSFNVAQSLGPFLAQSFANVLADHGNPANLRIPAAHILALLGVFNDDILNILIGADGISGALHNPSGLLGGYTATPNDDNFYIAVIQVLQNAHAFSSRVVPSLIRVLTLDGQTFSGRRPQVVLAAASALAVFAERGQLGGAASQVLSLLSLILWEGGSSFQRETRHALAEVIARVLPSAKESSGELDVAVRGDLANTLESYQAWVSQARVRMPAADRQASLELIERIRDSAGIKSEARADKTHELRIEAAFQTYLQRLTDYQNLPPALPQTGTVRRRGTPTAFTDLQSAMARLAALIIVYLEPATTQEAVQAFQNLWTRLNPETAMGNEVRQRMQASLDFFLQDLTQAEELANRAEARAEVQVEWQVGQTYAMGSSANPRAFLFQTALSGNELILKILAPVKKDVRLSPGQQISLDEVSLTYVEHEEDSRQAILMLNIPEDFRIEKHFARQAFRISSQYDEFGQQIVRWLVRLAVFLWTGLLAFYLESLFRSGLLFTWNFVILSAFFPVLAVTFYWDLLVARRNSNLRNILSQFTVHSAELKREIRALQNRIGKIHSKDFVAWMNDLDLMKMPDQALPNRETADRLPPLEHLQVFRSMLGALRTVEIGLEAHNGREDAVAFYQDWAKRMEQMYAAAGLQIIRDAEGFVDENLRKEFEVYTDYFSRRLGRAESRRLSADEAGEISRALLMVAHSGNNFADRQGALDRITGILHVLKPGLHIQLPDPDDYLETPQTVLSYDPESRRLFRFKRNGVKSGNSWSHDFEIDFENQSESLNFSRKVRERDEESFAGALGDFVERYLNFSRMQLNISYKFEPGWAATRRAAKAFVVFKSHFSYLFSTPRSMEIKVPFDDPLGLSGIFAAFLALVELEKNEAARMALLKPASQPPQVYIPGDSGRLVYLTLGMFFLALALLLVYKFTPLFSVFSTPARKAGTKMEKRKTAPVPAQLPAKKIEIEDEKEPEQKGIPIPQFKIPFSVKTKPGSGEKLTPFPDSQLTPFEDDAVVTVSKKDGVFAINYNPLKREASGGIFLQAGDDKAMDLPKLFPDGLVIKIEGGARARMTVMLVDSKNVTAFFDPKRPQEGLRAVEEEFDLKSVRRMLIVIEGNQPAQLKVTLAGNVELSKEQRQEARSEKDESTIGFKLPAGKDLKSGVSDKLKTMGLYNFLIRVLRVEVEIESESGNKVQGIAKQDLDEGEFVFPVERKVKVFYTYRQFEKTVEDGQEEKRRPSKTGELVTMQDAQNWELRPGADIRLQLPGAAGGVRLTLESIFQSQEYGPQARFRLLVPKPITVKHNEIPHRNLEREVESFSQAGGGNTTKRSRPFSLDFGQQIVFHDLSQNGRTTVVRLAVNLEKQTVIVTAPQDEILQRSEAREKLTLPGPLGEGPGFAIDFNVPAPVLERLKLFNRVPSSYPEAVKLVLEADIDPNDFSTSVFQDKKLFPYLFWYLEHLSDPGFRLDSSDRGNDEMKAFIDLEIRQITHDELYFSIRGEEKDDFNDLMLEIFKYVLVRVLAIEAGLRKREQREGRPEGSYEEHHKLIDDLYYYILGAFTHGPEVVSDPKQYYTGLLTELALAHPADRDLRFVISDFLTKWDERFKDGPYRQLVPFKEDQEETRAAKSQLLSELEAFDSTRNPLLKEAFTPQTETEKKLWDDPINAAFELYQNAPAVVLENEPDPLSLVKLGFDLSPLREFRLNWLEKFGGRFKQWVISDAANYLTFTGTFLEGSSQPQTFAEILPKLQAFLDLEGVAAPASVEGFATFLGLPPSFNENVRNELEFWLSLWQRKHSTGSKVLLLHNGLYYAEGNWQAWEKWLTRPADQRPRFAMLTGINDSFGEDIDGAPRQYFERGTAWVTHFSFTPDYLDIPFIGSLFAFARPTGDFPQSLYDLGKSQSRFPVWSGGVPIQNGRVKDLVATGQFGQRYGSFFDKVFQLFPGTYAGAAILTALPEKDNGGGDESSDVEAPKGGLVLQRQEARLQEVPVYPDVSAQYENGLLNFDGGDNAQSYARWTEKLATSSTGLKKWAEKAGLFSIPLQEFEREFFKRFLASVVAYKRTKNWMYPISREGKVSARTDFLLPGESFLQSLDNNGYFDSPEHQAFIQSYIYTQILEGPENGRWLPVYFPKTTRGSGREWIKQESARNLIRTAIEKNSKDFLESKLVVPGLTPDFLTRQTYYAFYAITGFFSDGILKFLMQNIQQLFLIVLVLVATQLGLSSEGIGATLMKWLPVRIADGQGILFGMKVPVWVALGAVPVLVLVYLMLKSWLSGQKEYAEKLYKGIFTGAIESMVLEINPKLEKKELADQREHIREAVATLRRRENPPVAWWHIGTHFSRWMENRKRNQLIQRTLKAVMELGTEKHLYRRILSLSEDFAVLAQNENLKLDEKVLLLSFLKETYEIDPAAFDALLKEWELQRYGLFGRVVRFLSAGYWQPDIKFDRVAVELYELGQLAKAWSVLTFRESLARAEAEETFRAGKEIPDTAALRAEVTFQKNEWMARQRMAFDKKLNAQLVRDLESNTDLTAGQKKLIADAFYGLGAYHRLARLKRAYDQGDPVNAVYEEALHAAANVYWKQSLTAISSQPGTFGETAEQAENLGSVLEAVRQQVKPPAEEIRDLVEQLIQEDPQFFQHAQAELEALFTAKLKAGETIDAAFDVDSVPSVFRDKVMNILKTRPDLARRIAGAMHEAYLDSTRYASVFGSTYYPSSPMIDPEFFDVSIYGSRAQALRAFFDEEDPSVQAVFGYQYVLDDRRRPRKFKLSLMHLKVVKKYLAGEVKRAQVDEEIKKLYQLGKQTDSLSGPVLDFIKTQLGRLDQYKQTPTPALQAELERPIVNPLEASWEYLVRSASKYTTPEGAPASTERFEFLVDLQLKMIAGEIIFFSNPDFLAEFGDTGNKPQDDETLRQYLARNPQVDRYLDEHFESSYGTKPNLEDKRGLLKLQRLLLYTHVHWSRDNTWHPDKLSYKTFTGLAALGDMVQRDWPFIKKPMIQLGLVERHHDVIVAAQRAIDAPDGHGSMNDVFTIPIPGMATRNEARQAAVRSESRAEAAPYFAGEHRGELILGIERLLQFLRTLKRPEEVALTEAFTKFLEQLDASSALSDNSIYSIGTSLAASARQILGDAVFGENSGEYAAPLVHYAVQRLEGIIAQGETGRVGDAALLFLGISFLGRGAILRQNVIAEHPVEISTLITLLDNPHLRSSGTAAEHYAAQRELRGEFDSAQFNEALRRQIGLLDSGNPNQRREAAYAMRPMKAWAAAAVPTLIRHAVLATEPDPAVRMNAVATLRAIGPAARAAVATMRNQLLPQNEPHTGVRRFVLYDFFIGASLVDPDEILPTLQQVAGNDPDETIRQMASDWAQQLNSARAEARAAEREILDPDKRYKGKAGLIGKAIIDPQKGFGIITEAALSNQGRIKELTFDVFDDSSWFAKSLRVGRASIEGTFGDYYWASDEDVRKHEEKRDRLRQRIIDGARDLRAAAGRGEEQILGIYREGVEKLADENFSLELTDLRNAIGTVMMYLTRRAQAAQQTPPAGATPEPGEGGDARQEARSQSRRNFELLLNGALKDDAGARESLSALIKTAPELFDAAAMRQIIEFSKNAPRGFNPAILFFQMAAAPVPGLLDPKLLLELLSATRDSGTIVWQAVFLQRLFMAVHNAGNLEVLARGFKVVNSNAVLDYVFALKDAPRAQAARLKAAQDPGSDEVIAIMGLDNYLDWFKGNATLVRSNVARKVFKIINPPPPQTPVSDGVIFTDTRKLFDVDFVVEQLPGAILLASRNDAFKVLQTPVIPAVWGLIQKGIIVHVAEAAPMAMVAISYSMLSAENKALADRLVDANVPGISAVIERDLYGGGEGITSFFVSFKLEDGETVGSLAKRIANYFEPFVSQRAESRRETVVSRASKRFGTRRSESRSAEAISRWLSLLSGNLPEFPLTSIEPLISGDVARNYFAAASVDEDDIPSLLGYLEAAYEHVLENVPEHMANALSTRRILALMRSWLIDAYGLELGEAVVLSAEDSDAARTALVAWQTAETARAAEHAALFSPEVRAQVPAYLLHQLPSPAAAKQQGEEDGEPFWTFERPAYIRRATSIQPPAEAPEEGGDFLPPTDWKPEGEGREEAVEEGTVTRMVTLRVVYAKAANWQPIYVYYNTDPASSTNVPQVWTLDDTLFGRYKQYNPGGEHSFGTTIEIQPGEGLLHAFKKGGFLDLLTDQESFVPDAEALLSGGRKLLEGELKAEELEGFYGRLNALISNHFVQPGMVGIAFQQAVEKEVREDEPGKEKKELGILVTQLTLLIQLVRSEARAEEDVVKAILHYIDLVPSGSYDRDEVFTGAVPEAFFDDQDQLLPYEKIEALRLLQEVFAQSVMTMGAFDPPLITLIADMKRQLTETEGARRAGVVAQALPKLSDEDRRLQRIYFARFMPPSAEEIARRLSHFSEDVRTQVEAASPGLLRRLYDPADVEAASKGRPFVQQRERSDSSILHVVYARYPGLENPMQPIYVYYDVNTQSDGREPVVLILDQARYEQFQESLKPKSEVRYAARTTLEALNGQEVSAGDLARASQIIVRAGTAEFIEILRGLAMIGNGAIIAGSERENLLRAERQELVRRFEAEFGTLDLPLEFGLALPQTGADDSFISRLAQWISTLGRVDSLVISGKKINAALLKKAGVAHVEPADFSRARASQEGLLAVANMDEAARGKTDASYLFVNARGIDQLQNDPLLQDHARFLQLFITATIAALKLKNASTAKKPEILAALLKVMGPEIYSRLITNSQQGFDLNVSVMARLEADQLARNEVRKAA